MNHMHSNNSKAYARHEFDLLTPPKKPRIELDRCKLEEVDDVWQLASRELPSGIAAGSVLKDVQIINKNNILTFKRDGKIVGVWAMLMLSRYGLEELLLGEFNSLDPDSSSLAWRLHTPVAIYVWAVVAPGLAAEGFKHVARFTRQPMYRSATIFSRPNTPLGVKLNQSLGFAPVQCMTPGLYRYTRLPGQKTQETFQQAA